MGWFGDLGEGEGLERSKKVNLGRKLVETEDEGKSSCEKLRMVLAVLLVVASFAKVPNTGFSDLQNIFGPPVR